MKEHLNGLTNILIFYQTFSNFDAEKYNIHHIIPCCTFKDKNHKTREECEKVADKFNENLIKLSIHNHFYAHYYLWKIFNDVDSKTAFQRMCGQGKYIDNLTENELKEIATLKEECAKKNQTEEDRKKKNDEYNKSHKQEREEYYKNHKEKIKKYKEENKDKIQKYQKEYNFNYYRNNKDKYNKYANDARKKILKNIINIIQNIIKNIVKVINLEKNKENIMLNYVMTL